MATTKTKPDYFCTEWVEVGIRGRWKGVPRVGRYETKSLTATHARIRANYPARTFPVTIIRDAGLPMAVHGDNIAISPGYDEAMKARREFVREEEAAKRKAARRQRAQAAAEILRDRLAAAPDGMKFETMVEGLMEFRDNGKLEA